MKIGGHFAACITTLLSKGKNFASWVCPRAAAARSLIDHQEILHHGRCLTIEQTSTTMRILCKIFRDMTQNTRKEERRKEGLFRSQNYPQPPTNERLEKDYETLFALHATRVPSSKTRPDTQCHACMAAGAKLEAPLHAWPLQ